MSSPGEARSREKISSLALVLTRVHVCVFGGGGAYTGNITHSHSYRYEPLNK